MEQLEQPMPIETQNCDGNQNLAGERDEVAINEGKEGVHQNDNNESNCGEGSNNYLGKFNSVQDLVNAYNSLQAEFTRKCQRLKQVEEDNQNLNQKILDGNAQKEEPIYLKEDFSNQLSNFLQNNPNAKKYAKEISLEVANSNVNLTQAYNNVLAKMYKEPEELVKDKDFINNYVLNDNDVKKELIKNYLKNVKESNAPTLISGASGLYGGRAKDIEISSLEEANKLALKMFKGD